MPAFRVNAEEFNRLAAQSQRDKARFCAGNAKERLKRIPSQLRFIAARESKSALVECGQTLRLPGDQSDPR